MEMVGKERKALEYKGMCALVGSEVVLVDITNAHR